MIQVDQRVKVHAYSLTFCLPVLFIVLQQSWEQIYCFKKISFSHGQQGKIMRNLQLAPSLTDFRGKLTSVYWVQQNQQFLRKFIRAAGFFLRPPTFTASNFQVLSTTDPILTELKDQNLLKERIKTQKASSILKVGFALSK